MYKHENVKKNKGKTTASRKQLSAKAELSAKNIGLLNMCVFLHCNSEK